MISFKEYIQEASVHPDLAAHGITATHVKNFLDLQKKNLGGDPYGATKGQKTAYGRARNKFYNDESLTNVMRHKMHSHYDTHGARGMMSEEQDAVGKQ